MRFQIPKIVAGLAPFASNVAADHLTTVEGCDITNAFRICGLYHSTFLTAFGEWRVDANEECRGTSVPGMTDFCMDWNNRRGHFKFSHQNFKRCLVREDTTRFVDGCDGIECWRTEWRERECRWREIPSNGTISANGTVWEAGVNYSTTAAAPVRTGAAEREK